MAEAQLVIQNIGGVTVVDFSDAAILDGPTIASVGRRLYELTDEQAQRKILLVLSQVKFFSSSMLGVLINLHKKSATIKGRVAIAGLHRTCGRSSRSPARKSSSSSTTTKRPR